MSITETLYQLTEQDTSKVNGLWKALPIIGYIFAAFAAFFATTSFYILLNGFSWNCVLYTVVEFRTLTQDDTKYEGVVSNGTNVTIDSSTIWNRDLVCQYCLLIWMISFIGGIILGAFFILNPRGGKGFPDSIFTQPWKMVVPVLLVTILMAILSSIASIIAVNGINIFCASFGNYTENNSCSKNIDIYTLEFRDEIQPIHGLQKMVKAGSIMTSIAWACCVILLLVRLYRAPDFHLQIINIVPCERKHPEFQEKKIYSEPSDSVLPLSPVFEELPIDTDEYFQENKKEPVNSNQSSDGDQSNDNVLSPPNNDDSSTPAPPNNNDNNSTLPSYSYDTNSKNEKVFFKML